MSSRLPYLSEDFHVAAQHPDTLKRWEQQQYRLFQSRVQKGAAIADLLAAAELALRCEDAAGLRQYLDKLLSKAPGEGDVHYLKALFLRSQKDSAGLLAHLQQCTPKLRQASADHGRIHRLLAEQLLQQGEIVSAGHSLRKAFELAGSVPFVHCTTRSEANKRELEFDLALFDALFPWDHTPLQVRFSSLSTDASHHVYVLEHRHQWVFCFDAEGKFVEGLTERDLASAPFIHPELSWDLTDITVDRQGHRYVCGSSDRVYVFNSQWQQERYLIPPASRRSLRPLSMSIDAHQNLYVIYLHLGGIHWYNPDGYHMGAFGQNTIMPSLGKNYFCGLAVTPTNQVCLYDRERLQIYQPGQPEPLHTWSLPGLDGAAQEQPDYPFCWNGVAADAQAIYACDTYGHRILRLNPATGDCQPLPSGGWQQPFDVAADGRGTLYVADTGHGRILKSQGPDWQILLGHPAFQGAV
ncbi:MAG: hypothetical protein ACO1RX_00140 [Candidatus Sericytochromatia bacterium]